MADVERSFMGIVYVFIIMLACALFIGVFANLARAELSDGEKAVVVENELLIESAWRDALAAEERATIEAVPGGFWEEVLEWVGLRAEPEEVGRLAKEAVLVEREALVTDQFYDFVKEAELVEVPTVTHEEPIIEWNPSCSVEFYDVVDNVTGLNATYSQQVGCNEQTGTRTVTDASRQVIVTSTQAYPIDANKEWCYQTSEEIICKDALHSDAFTHTPEVRYGYMWRTINKQPRNDGTIEWTQHGDHDINSIVQPIQTRKEMVTQ